MVNKLLEYFSEKTVGKDKSNRVQDWKTIKKIGAKLYLNWKGYDNSFNSWRDQKYIII